ncbi:hypothetical protein WMF30_37420 [Sorangium sp. So ce134]
MGQHGLMGGRRAVYIGGMPIATLAPLSGLQALESLAVTHLGVFDISALSTMPSLEHRSR